MLVRFAQEAKALLPIEVTLSGMVILVNEPQSPKAKTPIDTTGLPSYEPGTSKAPEAEVLQEVTL